MRKIMIATASLLAMAGTALAQQQPNTPTGSGSNNELATQRTDPNTAKPYQPNNPEPDNRTATTGSSSGKGPDSGGRPEMAPKK